MKQKTTAMLLIAAGLSIWGCHRTVEIEANRLPQDVLQSCTLDSNEFNSWFASGQATENGAVNPANSITFPHQNNCDFYKWSQQMFLWITSPSQGEYGNSGTVMESPVFYTVSPPLDSAGNRDLMPHIPGQMLEARSNIKQNGPNNLPVVFDKKGRMFEVESAASGKKPVIKNAAGKATEVSRVERKPEGGLKFFDNAGKEISNAKPLLKHTANASRILQEFIVNGQSVLLDGNGNEIETETSQAGSHGALMAQNGSLVYYISMVNDVYAYFMSGAKNNALNGNTFPTDSASSAAISAYARQQQWVPAPDSNALAIEIKTSWVETTNLKDSDSYITIDAVIPEYNKSNPNGWAVSGHRTARLALIGMHIVGSAAGHPEMIWATFEHLNNAPNAAYTYLDSNNVVKTVPADTGSNWLLNNNASSPNVNQQNMIVSNDSILAYGGNTISPSNTQMICAFGVATNTRPNAEDATPAASNSEVISINNAVRKLLKGKDIRKNYMLIGATWTFGGAAPTGISYAYPLPGDSTAGIDTAAGVAIGTSQLANSTMETYVQDSASLYTQYGSCLSCHSNNNGLAPDDLSHIYGGLIPLNPMDQLRKKK